MTTTIHAGSDAQGHEIRLHCQDLGSGKPVVLLHGWPLSSASWEYQLAELPRHGLRVVAYDRRGFGLSSKPWEGYDYDHFADDLKAVLDELDLHEVTLVGFSMGAGEVARYMSRHGGARVAQVAFIAGVTPFLLKTPENRTGVEHTVFDGMIRELEADRFDFLAGFTRKFFGVGLLSKPVSEATLKWADTLALPASPKAVRDCVRAFAATDFREDLRGLRVPALIIHGSHDQIVPREASAEPCATLLPRASLRIYDGAPHGLMVTHKDELNADLLRFVHGS